jgi:hypothetical protein
MHFQTWQSKYKAGYFSGTSSARDDLTVNRRSATVRFLRSDIRLWLGGWLRTFHLHVSYVCFDANAVFRFRRIDLQKNSNLHFMALHSLIDQKYAVLTYAENDRAINIISVWEHHNYRYRFKILKHSSQHLHPWTWRWVYLFQGFSFRVTPMQPSQNSLLAKHMLCTC